MSKKEIVATDQFMQLVEEVSQRLRDKGASFQEVVDAQTQGQDEDEVYPPVRVGAFDLDVVYSPDTALQGCLGQYDEAKQQIRLAEGMAAEMERNVILHEAYHSALSQAGKREHDEEIIDIFAAATMQIARDNPWLFRAYEAEAMLLE